MLKFWLNSILGGTNNRAPVDGKGEMSRHSIRRLRAVNKQSRLDGQNIELAKTRLYPRLVRNQ